MAESLETSPTSSGVAPWVAPAEGDSRSPCPALNSLANHGYLDHSGKNLHFTEVLHATKKQYGLDTAMATSLTLGGAIACGHIGLDGAKFDLHELAKHNRIEHDGSLSHGPTPPGGEWAPIVPDPTAIEKTIEHSSDGGEHLTLEDLARARVDAEGDKPLDPLHARIGRGEVALTLLTMGDGDRVTTDRVRTWYGGDRLPDDYVPPAEGSVSLKRVNNVVNLIDVAMRAERDKKNGD